MGMVKYILYDSLKSGLKGLKAKDKAAIAEQSEAQKMMHEVTQQAKINSEQMQKVLHEVMTQAKANTDQLARHLDHMTQAHLDVAKLLLDALKQMHGMP